MADKIIVGKMFQLSGEVKVTSVGDDKITELEQIKKFNENLVAAEVFINADVAAEVYRKYGILIRVHF